MEQLKLSGDALQIIAVAGIRIFLGQGEQLLFGNKLGVIGDFFNTTDFGVLALFDNTHKGQGFVERSEGVGITPSDTAIKANLSESQQVLEYVHSPHFLTAAIIRSRMRSADGVRMR